MVLLNKYTYYHDNSWESSRPIIVYGVASIGYGNTWADIIMHTNDCGIFSSRRLMEYLTLGSQYEKVSNVLSSNW